MARVGQKHYLYVAAKYHANTINLKQSKARRLTATTLTAPFVAISISHRLPPSSRAAIYVAAGKNLRRAATYATSAPSWARAWIELYCDDDIDYIDYLQLRAVFELSLSSCLLSAAFIISLPCFELSFISPLLPWFTFERPLPRHAICRQLRLPHAAASASTDASNIISRECLIAIRSRVRDDKLYATFRHHRHKHDMLRCSLHTSLLQSIAAEDERILRWWFIDALHLLLIRIRYYWQGMMDIVRPPSPFQCLPT